MLAEFMKASLDKLGTGFLKVFQNESGREGVDFIIKANAGNRHKLSM
jgi:hypothetical protein